MIFDGKKIRDEIMSDLASRILKLKKKPVLAVIWVGNNAVTAKYVEIKQKQAEKLGIKFNLIKYDESAEESGIFSKIDELNANNNIDGVMVQIPLPKNIDQNKVIAAISPKKDIDGLRFCSNLSCDFKPPVVGAILQALKLCSKKLFESKIVVVGKGFLVGAPLIRALTDLTRDLQVADSSTENLSQMTGDADIIISATGKPNIITPMMVKDGVVLVDAGTSESNGALTGDIDPAAYSKASFYTPVPGGIGPVTVAMLFRNLVEAAEKTNN
jgi:methylenetetrahydrofolate dehydrogenase (NADP+)/methenyltetrahydrofolate cyclohydrolase